LEGYQKGLPGQKVFTKKGWATKALIILIFPANFLEISPKISKGWDWLLGTLRDNFGWVLKINKEFGWSFLIFKTKLIHFY